MNQKSFLDPELNEITSYLDRIHLKHEGTSAVDLSWHLAHMLLVAKEMTRLLERSDSTQYKPKFSAGKLYLMITGHIPRGVVQSPKSVIPRQNRNADYIEKLLLDVRNLLPLFEVLPSEAFMQHPYFGHLSTRQCKRFIICHTRHHLKIIRDIVNGNL